MAANLYAQRDSNVRKTIFLMTVFFIAVIALGFLFAQAFQSPVILYVAVALSFGMNIASYWYSDKIALAMSAAQPVERNESPELFRIIENLSITAGLPMPKVYMIPGAQINAFATGRNAQHAAIAVTQGAMSKLTKSELEGVLAHELSHIGNRDILISSVAVVLAGVVAIMADFFLRSTFFRSGRSRDNDRDGGNPVMVIIAIAAALLAPLAATLIRLAISRKREFLADSSGALLTRYPDGLASALEKIAHDDIPLSTAHNATAHLFLSNPFRQKEGTNWLVKLFMTHPPLEERIAILRGMK